MKGLAARREEEARRKRVAPLLSIARKSSDPLHRAQIVHAAKAVPMLARGASDGFVALSDDEDTMYVWGGGLLLVCLHRFGIDN